MASPTDRRATIMLALWKRMREYFGQSWVREYGDANSDSISTWTDALEHFTEEQIARGVKACQDWREPFPPNLGQFKQLCLTVRHERNFTEERIALEKQHGTSIASIEHLTREKANDSPIARKAKAEIKAILAGKSEYVLDGKTYPCQTKEQAIHKLSLNARWSRSAQ